MLKTVQWNVIIIIIIIIIIISSSNVVVVADADIHLMSVPEGNS